MIPSDSYFENLSIVQYMPAFLDIANLELWEMFSLSFITSVFLTIIASVIAYTPCPKGRAANDPPNE
jgi:hypothetical protein